MPCRCVLSYERFLAFRCLNHLQFSYFTRNRGWGSSRIPTTAHLILVLCPISICCPITQNRCGAKEIPARRCRTVGIGWGFDPTLIPAFFSVTSGFHLLGKLSLFSGDSLRTAVSPEEHGHSLADATMIAHGLASGFTLREYHRWRRAIPLLHPNYDTLPGCSDPAACMCCSGKHCQVVSASRFQ